MTNVYCVQKNSDKIDRNKQIVRSADAFIDRSLERGLFQKYEEARACFGLAERKGNKFIVGLIAFYVLCFIGLVLVAFSIRLATTEGETGDVVAYMLPAGIVCFAVGAVGIVLFVLLYKRYKKSAYYLQAAGVLEAFIKSAREELRVPADALEIDVITPFFGRSKRSLKFYNLPKRVFREGDALCFADLHDVVKIPLEKITIKRVNVRLFVYNWTKEEHFSKGQYKQYKIRSSRDGAFGVKPYYRLDICDGAEDYQILIPCYDIDLLLSLTGKQVAA